MINPIGGTLQMLGSRDGSQNWGQSANLTTQNAPTTEQATAIPEEPPMDFDDDIPF